MKNLLIAATALTLISAPAHAQLLGGGGVGGALGGTLGGAGSIGTPLRSSVDSIRSTTRTATNATGSTEGSQSVDRRSGSVKADRRANGGIATGTSQLLSSPITPVGADATGSGNASANGNGQAQLIGTDGASALVQNGTSQLRGAASSARGLASPALSQANASATTAAGSASGNAAGSANGASSLASSPLAAAGSAAAAGNGAFAVKPGMMIMSPEGNPLGRVREVVADGRGQIQQVAMRAKGVTTMVPAGNLSASGDALIFAEGNGEATTSPENEPAAE